MKHEVLNAKKEFIKEITLLSNNFKNDKNKSHHDLFFKYF